MDIGIALIASVGALALFTFLAVASYADARTKERLSYYRNETFKKLAEQSGDGADRVLEMIREEEQIDQRRRLEGLKLGGLITTMVGIGTMVFLGVLAAEIALAGLIPLLIGLSLLAYVFLLAPKPGRGGPSGAA